MKINDTVQLVVNLPNDGLYAGAIGVVVDQYTTPNVAYEIEFCGEDGETIAQVALKPDQFKLLNQQKS
jgi:hypothetical protein